MKRNIFVIGHDDFNMRKLRTLGNGDEYEFQGVFMHTELKDLDREGLRRTLPEAEEQIRAFPGTVDAIVGYWDFPISDMVPMLCRTFDLPAPSLESVVKCEHKYWSRIEQQAVIPDCVPRFALVDPFDDGVPESIELDYPYWLKPVKSFASYLGFRIGRQEDLETAITKIRANIRRLGEAFNYVLEHLNLPPNLSGIGGNHCIAEEIISGRQCTLEGYVYRGEPHVYGVVDSIRTPNRSSFARYEYPSRLPQRVQERMCELAEQVIRHIGLDNAPFNMEFFYEKQRDKIWLLEVNPRISQSHCDLFEKVDGCSHHKVMLDLALGHEPHPPEKRGEFHRAAKFFIRHFKDALVTHVPGNDVIQRLEEELPGTLVQCKVHQGMQLSELRHQDSYSYELAEIFIGAADQKELLEKYRRCVEVLQFGLDEVREPAGPAAFAGPTSEELRKSSREPSRTRVAPQPY